MSPASDEWYYLFEGEIYGPVPRRRLQEGLKTGSLPPDTPVRSSRLEDWHPAHETPLSPESSARSSAAQSEKAASALSDLDLEIKWDTTPRPWRRYLARMLDVTLFIVIAGFFFGVVLFAQDPVGFLVNINFIERYAEWVGMAGLIAFIPVEAWMLSRWHTTPGKWVAGLRVIRSDGRAWTFQDTLLRSWGVCWRGMGLGVPFVSFIAMIVGYRKLTSQGRATWDINYNFDVANVGMEPIRWMGLCGLIGLLLWFFV